MADDLLGGLGGLVDGLKGLMPDKDGDGKPDVDLASLLGQAKGLVGGANDDKVDTKSDLEDLIKGLTKFADKDGDGKPDVGPLLEQAKGLLTMFGGGAGSGAGSGAGAGTADVGGAVGDILKGLM